MDGEEEEGVEQGEEEEQVGGVTKENDEVKRAGKEEQELKENELKVLLLCDKCGCWSVR